MLSSPSLALTHDRPSADAWNDLVTRLAGFLFVGCGAASAFTAGPVHGRARLASLGVSLASIALGSLVFTWRRGRSDRVTLMLLPIAGLALIACGNAFGSSQPYDYAVFYVIVHAWVGLAHPPKTSLKLAPLTALAYVGPLFVVAPHPVLDLPSAVTTIAASVLVGEGIAWLMARVDATERKSQRLAATLVSERETNEEMRRLWSLLERSERRYRTLVNALPVVTYVDAADELSTPLFISPQVHTLTGFPPEAWMRDPKLWVRLLDVDDRDDVLRMHLRSNETGQDFHAEYRLRTRDDRIVWVRDDAYLVEEPNGERWWQGVLIDVTELKRTQQELEHLAHHDATTGLTNRALFDAELDAAIARARRSGEMVAVCTLDLDKFKLVNDTLGHAAGDALLRAVADRLTSTVREGDIVSRIGGDEFGLILSVPEAASNASAARLVVDEVRTRVTTSLAEGVVVADTEVSSSASFGAAVFPADGTDASTLLRVADRRMYGKKRNDRLEDRSLSIIVDALHDEHVDLGRRLRQSAESGGWELRYQLIVELALGTGVGCEALIRWNDPLFGLRSPDEFLGTAEELGLAPALLEWTTDRVASDAADWDRVGVTDRMTMITLNLSPRELWNPALARRLDDLIGRLPGPDLLVIEVTESAVMADPGRAASVLHDIRAKGVRLALDDFGTGYSSLGRLRSLPFDIVKIDRSFIHDLEHDHRARSVVRSVVRLVSSLGMVALAEGIETERQSEIAADEGCVLGQGFLFGPPVSSGRFAADIAASPRAADLVTSTQFH